MRKLLVSLVVAAFAAGATGASAAKTKCKPGFKYDKTTKMCVARPPRGSF